MIEFKADCGHTVRAKDDDAGKVVRCAYCGREAQVPDEQTEDDFDLFFAEREAESAQSSTRTPAQREARPRRRRPATATRAAANADPFAVIKKMAYAAAVLIVVIFVSKRYVVPLIDELQSPTPPAGAKTAPIQPTPITDQQPTQPKPAHYGLLRPTLERGADPGVHLKPVPEDVTIWYRQKPAEPSRTRDCSWVGSVRNDVLRVAGPPYNVRDKLLPGTTYEFAVALPINDPQVMSYRSYDYNTFRSEVEDKCYGPRPRPEDAHELASDWFRPDEAVAVRVLPLRGHLNLVRIYETTIRADEWSVITAMFLPNAVRLMDIKSLLPPGKEYHFDEKYVLEELAYYEVPAGERGYIVDALYAIGAISYRAADDPQRYRMFKIDPYTGLFAAPYLDEELWRDHGTPGSP